ncbi:MAG TPA: S-layer homology domain-containing protein [Thermoleophilia bacterium]|nr:S-layer homology domain-containing protein [Thermoleophilia bacterium]
MMGRAGATESAKNRIEGRHLNLAIVAMMLCVLLALLLPVAAQAGTYTAEEMQFVKILNEYRAANGLGTLLVSDMVSVAATKHDMDMAKYSFFDHVTQGSDYYAVGASPWARMAAAGYNYNTTKGENLAAGFSTAAGVFEGWRNSPGHNANMLNGGFKVVGISMDLVPGSQYLYYWTTDFGGYVDSTSHSVDSLSTQRFIDVPPTHSYASQIEALADLGVISGFGDGYFQPNASVVREQFAKMIVLTLGLPVSESDVPPFADVQVTPGSLYPAAYIAVAARAGITRGVTADRFAPWNKITRAEVITMVVRAANLPEPPADYQPPFGDFSPTFYPYARKAAYAGILDGLVGMGSSYNFWTPATRGEVCALLSSLMQ